MQSWAPLQDRSRCGDADGSQVHAPAWEKRFTTDGAASRPSSAFGPSSFRVSLGSSLFQICFQLYILSCRGAIVLIRFWGNEVDEGETGKWTIWHKTKCWLVFMEKSIRPVIITPTELAHASLNSNTLIWLMQYFVAGYLRLKRENGQFGTKQISAFFEWKSLLGGLLPRCLDWS